MSGHLDIDLLRTFVAIAEARTLVRAAERIGRTQAAVSMQVKKLEGLLSQPLLNRTGRGVTLSYDFTWKDRSTEGLPRDTPESGYNKAPRQGFADQRFSSCFHRGFLRS